jgi:hypothetical protein
MHGLSFKADLLFVVAGMQQAYAHLMNLEDASGGNILEVFTILH